MESRLRNAADFRATLRGGVRCGRPSLVVHARRSPLARSRAGFVVSKAVGNAVTRNRVKRQLRHLVAPWLAETEVCVDVVIRALPSAASSDLREDLTGALSTCLDRVAA